MDSTGLLRSALRANALFTVASGAAVTLRPAWFSRALDLPVWLLMATGGLLVCYGLALGLLARSPRVASPWAVAAVALDLGWVAGSAVFLAAHPVGNPALVLAPCVAVLAFAALQVAGLHQAMFTATGGRFSLSRRVEAPVDRAWAVVSDVARYAEVAGTLRRSEVLSGSGVGMVRRCEDANGVCWLETCTRWEPGRAYSFEVDTSAPGYPLPLRTMRGDFEVGAVDANRSLVCIRFTLTPRGGLATEVALALLFAIRGERLVGEILRRWARQIEGPSSGATSTLVGEGTR